MAEESATWEAPEEKPRRRRGRAQTSTEEAAPAPEPPTEENAPAPEPDTPAPVLSQRTCVFCSETHQVDLQDLDGAQIISQPELGINHFICAGCNHAA